MRVLLIEDDPAVAKMVELTLASEGIVCDIGELGQDCIEMSKSADYDLIIMDLMLPDMSGQDVLRQLQERQSKVPVLILSGIKSYEEKIKSLGYGADDYLTKPFNQGELTARVKAIIRRWRGYTGAVIQIDGLMVNMEKHTTLVNGRPVHLTGKEQAMLELLAIRKGNTVSKEAFLNHIYNGMDEPELKIIDVFVCRMRKKLMEASNGVNYIETSWGRGYALKDPRQILDIVQ
ncbi:MAG: response regulator transcription factor [Proteobacteria bacterium]|nr:response regulator transcription factor [Pseudomonadota bacterium]